MTLPEKTRVTSQSQATDFPIASSKSKMRGGSSPEQKINCKLVQGNQFFACKFKVNNRRGSALPNKNANRKLAQGNQSERQNPKIRNTYLQCLSNISKPQKIYVYFRQLKWYLVQLVYRELDSKIISPRTLGKDNNYNKQKAIFAKNL